MAATVEQLSMTQQEMEAQKEQLVQEVGGGTKCTLHGYNVKDVSIMSLYPYHYRLPICVNSF